MEFDPGWMIGQVLTDVACIGPDHWRFAFGSGGILLASCPWRVLDGNTIAASSADHGHLFGLPEPVDSAYQARTCIAGRAIEQAELRSDSLDLLLTMSGGARLELLVMSQGYESWDLTVPSGFRRIAQGGGKLLRG